MNRPILYLRAKSYYLIILLVGSIYTHYATVFNLFGIGV